MRIERSPGFPSVGSPGLSWLGQAGFWIETGSHRILIDPYLSDSLAIKYAGKENDHRRMMPAPVQVGELPQPDLVLVSHAHGDHMDPMTLGPLARRFPGLVFVIPAARQAIAQDRIGPEAHLVPVDAGDVVSPLPGLTLTVIPAAHESFDLDDHGRHPYVGFGIETYGLRIYHSGDCIPFRGLQERISAFAPQILLLPVNGRDAARLAAGIPGNFTLAEAIALSSGSDYLIPHHFGMFAFNTLDPATIDRVVNEWQEEKPCIIRPNIGETLRIRP